MGRVTGECTLEVCHEGPHSRSRYAGSRPHLEPGPQPGGGRDRSGDYDEARARLVAERVGAGKTRPIFLDASDTAAVAKAATGAKLVVNAVIPEYNLSIMRACLAAGAAYQDMASGQTRAKTIDEPISSS